RSGAVAAARRRRPSRARSRPRRSRISTTATSRSWASVAASITEVRAPARPHLSLPRRPPARDPRLRSARPVAGTHVAIERGSVTRPSVAVLIATVALAVRAGAAPAPAKLAALAPGSTDARDAVALGPHGEAYEPDGKGAWIRRHGGGLA